MRTLFPALLSVLLAGPALASETRSLAAGAVSPPATLSQLAWLAGSWKGDGLGAVATEVYSSPEAGQIAGHFTLAENGKLLFYELMQIVPRGTSLVYRLRHFNADLTGWEDAKAGTAVEFPLVAIDGETFFFAGLTLRRIGADAMDVWVSIDGDHGAKDEVFHYRRGAP